MNEPSKRISVLIPTAAQPELLRTALTAIANQTAVDQIAEVLVAENLSDTRSRTTCEAYPQLPIRYILRDPPVSPTHNFVRLFAEAQGEFQAFVCDDDWWGPNHLRAGLAALDAHAEAVASFSASLFVASEMPAHAWLSRPAALWLAAGKPDPAALWLVKPEHILHASMICTPFHTSSMIARSDIVKEEGAKLGDAPFYQLDRLLFLRLAGRGPATYEPNPDTFIRWRPDNVTNRMDLQVRDQTFRRVTEEAIQTSTARGIDTVGWWRQQLAGIDSVLEEELTGQLRRAMDDTQLRARGFSRFIEPPVRRALRNAVAKGRATIARAKRH